jgi:RNA polymerase sigma-70 factor (ECF subfamily)
VAGRYSDYLHNMLAGVDMENTEGGDVFERHELLEQLYIAYAKLMYHTAYHILQDKYLSEDAVHTAFLRLEKNNFKICSVSCNKTKAFLVIITRNIAINIYNEKKREVSAFSEDELADTLPDGHLLPLDTVISNEGIALIKQALTVMDQKYSDVILMKYFSDYTISEIASLFNISEQLVRVRLFRARKQLTQILARGDR